MRIGILAVQGAVEPHRVKFENLGVESVQVKTPKDLVNLAGLVLPGGESSSMIHLLKLNGLWESVSEFVHQKPSWGLCAGTILLAKEVISPAQESLGVIDITVVRNAYGRQTESFISNLNPSPNWVDQESLEGIFIRAPKISRLGPSVKTLFTHHGDSVMVREGITLASTFHPELSESNKLHQYFLSLCQESR
ncbi:MAG: pyridoxal 5'-phosphate synthase glutaminase subunit PdxT [Proteobacteria bacterium]|nr:pyridoxal 5'-phosphate synthase glutaminase subunit PdxT [Pseudomonadota bacterium]